MGADGAQSVVAGCTCEAHRSIYDTWPWQNAELRISSCMRTCPYCGASKKTASNLRTHLRGAHYRARNLDIALERHGCATTRVPSWRRLYARTSGSDVVVEATVDDQSANRHLEDASSSNQDADLDMSPTVDIIKVLDDNSVEGITNCLWQLGFDTAPLHALQTSALHALSSIPVEVNRLWTQSTTSPPLILSAEACWRSPVPTFEQLWLALAELPREELRVFERGEADGNPFSAYCQLAEPKMKHATYIIGATPPPIIREYQFRPPEEMLKFATPYMEKSMTFNVTPKYSFIDLHIDYGMDGLSASMHKCEKIWCMYPPTEKNMLLMAGQEGLKGKLTRLANSLEGGVTFKTTSDDAVYIPSGSLHAVFTSVGGFLVTMDFTTRDSISPFSRYLYHRLDFCMDDAGRSNCHHMYLDCLSVALENRQVDRALKGWISIEKVAGQIATDNRAWKVAALKLWRNFLQTPVAKNTMCPCAMGSGGRELKDHFGLAHLSYIDPQVSSRPRSRRAPMESSVR